MRTYEELVKEAIETARKEAEAAAKAKQEETKQFVVGKKYTDNFITNSEAWFTVTVLKRTEKTVTIEVNGKTKRCKIYDFDNGDEAIFPFGQYSMAPVLHSSDIAA